MNEQFPPQRKGKGISTNVIVGTLCMPRLLNHALSIKGGFDHPLKKKQASSIKDHPADSMHGGRTAKSFFLASIRFSKREAPI